ncbi:hypothetical protein E0H75_40940 [Kribbella capetownensis]|uniref:Uncharacterized protein n=1 Tax=Kribbella capetownensis TaxID=1572659 RepID=A0A4R0J5M1_9ACTN|nr:hypothetical protein [Kribbella capetownensis]TCC36635.1 hypothetical protein E0H75_40940 [Kribbella capetownensis]
MLPSRNSNASSPFRFRLGSKWTPPITLRVYAHVIRQHADEAANTFAAAIDGDDQADTAEGDGGATE